MFGVTLSYTYTIIQSSKNDIYICHFRVQSREPRSCRPFITTAFGTSLSGKLICFTPSKDASAVVVSPAVDQVFARKESIWNPRTHQSPRHRRWWKTSLICLDGCNFLESLELGGFPLLAVLAPYLDRWSQQASGEISNILYASRQSLKFWESHRGSWS